MSCENAVNPAMPFESVQIFANVQNVWTLMMSLRHYWLSCYMNWLLLLLHLPGFPVHVPLNLVGRLWGCLHKKKTALKSIQFDCDHRKYLKPMESMQQMWMAPMSLLSKRYSVHFLLVWVNEIREKENYSRRMCIKRYFVCGFLLLVSVFDVDVNAYSFDAMLIPCDIADDVATVSLNSCTGTTVEITKTILHIDFSKVSFTWNKFETNLVGWGERKTTYHHTTNDSSLRTKSIDVLMAKCCSIQLHVAIFVNHTAWCRCLAFADNSK